MVRIDEWLAAHGLGHLADTFREAEIDGEVLPHLTEADLRDLGLPLGARIKLRNAIAALADGGAPPAAAEAAPASGQDAERRHLTVMFVDLVGSTALAGRLDPEDMREVITGYQNAAAGVVTRFGGQIAKYMGDGVLCYFGWPRAGEDDPERAVRAGLGVIEAVGAIAAPDGERLTARVGISTGLVVVGDLTGEGAAQEQAVIGETPNLAARLQSVARPGQLVVSAATHQLLARLFETKPLGRLDLKGIAEPVEAFIVSAERRTETRFDARLDGILDPMVGREHELGLILERWRRAKANEGQLVIVQGEAGIGKSRLARSAVEAICTEEPIRLSYQCSPYHSDSSFYPVIQQLGFSAGLRAGDPVDTQLDKLEARLVTADPAIMATLVGIDGTARYGAHGLSPQLLRQRILTSLSDELVALSRQRPVLFVMEDVHWIDASTLELLDHCLEQISGERVLILLTARPTFGHGFGGHPIVTRLALNRLGMAQIREIVGRIAGGRALPGELIDAIAARTDGVPLFVEELTKTILESGELRETEGGYQLVRPLSRMSIPATLHDSLMARIDRLQPVKEVAQVAACIGREFDHAMLSEIAGIEEAKLQEALAQLTSAELIFRRGSGDARSYVFKHALVRDVAYQSLLRARRQQIHCRILERLEAAGDGAPELMAHHATEAGEIARAIPHWAEAGGRAAARPAYDEAVSHLRTAIRLIETLPDRAAWHIRELSMLVQLAQVFIAKIGYASREASETFARAAAMLDDGVDPELRVAALYGNWIGPYIGGEHTSGLEIANRLVADVDAAGTPLPRLIAHRMRSANLIAMGRPVAALDDLAISRGIYETTSVEDFASRFAQDLGVQISCYELLALWLNGRQDEALATSEAALARARTLNHANTFCYAALHHVTLCFWAGAPAAARPINDDLMRLAREHDMTLWQLYGRLHEIVLACQEDQPGAAEAMVEGLADYRAERCRLWMTLYMAEQAKGYLRLGRPGDAAAAVAEGEAVMEAHGERWAEAEFLRIRGLLAQAAGQHDGAMDLFDRAVAVATAQDAHALALRAGFNRAALLSAGGSAGDATESLSVILSRLPAGADGPEVRAARLAAGAAEKA